MVRMIPLLFVLISCTKDVPPLAIANCACTASRSSVERDYARADVVFTGTVSGMSRASQMDNSGMRGGGPRTQAILMKVHSRYKGDVPDQVTLYGDTAWACAYPFATEEHYLVYAWKEHRYKNELTTTACVRTMPYADAEHDIKKLRALRTLEEEQ